MYRNKLVLLSSLSLLFISGYGQSQYNVFTLAGDTANLYQGSNSNAGYRDGAASVALFNGPTGIAVDSAGEYVYVADTYNNVIRKINTAQGIVTTLAGDTVDIRKGLDSNIGYANGAPYAAKFSNPLGLCVDDSGNVYVADTYNNVIRKIWASTGMVTTYAGKDSAGITFQGYVNGPDSVAEFFLPTSLAVDKLGNLYVTDNGNNSIREIWASTHRVTTLAGRGPDTSGYYINGPIDTAEFYSLYGIALGSAGDIFVTQFEDGGYIVGDTIYDASGYNAIRRLYHDTVTTFSGYDIYGFDTAIGAKSGYRNGKDTVGIADTVVLYNNPTGITLDTLGNVLVADEYNNVIRIINARDSVVSTFAGNDTLGFRNGADSVAEFYNPVGIAANKKGNFYVSDLGNNIIREITTHTTTGINPVKKIAAFINAYPNPCTDRLTIISSYAGNAELLDITGRTIWADNNFKSTYTLSTSSISPGIYFLRITSQNATEIKKIEILK